MNIWKEAGSAIGSILFISFICLGSIALVWFTANNGAVKAVAILFMGPVYLVVAGAIVAEFFRQLLEHVAANSARHRNKPA